MPFQVTISGVVREFELFAPPGWEYFVEENYSVNGRDGLPLLVMLHGGGQEVSGMKAAWPFGLISLGDKDLKDRFFVLVPYGSTTFDDPTGPFRGWNVGYTGGIDAPDVDDVAFISAAVTRVKGWLDDQLTALGSSRKSIDPGRRFLFGYSNGGMMAYKLAASMGDTWAAMWVQSGSFGGKSESGITSLVENTPAGTDPVALFVHHGDLDENVLPGTLGAVSELNVSTSGVARLNSQGILPPYDENYTRADRSCAGATAVFKTLNGLQSAPYTDTTNNPDLAGGNTSRRREWRNTGGDPYPVVDPAMTHTNFTSSANRYFDADDVWAWFKSQTP